MSGHSSPPRSLMHTIGRRLGVVAVVVALALGLSGCVLVKDVAVTQVGGIGDVQVSATICATKTTPCPGGANTPYDPPAGVTPTQLLLGYRVPQGAGAPPALRFSDDGGAGPVFRPVTTYASELQRLAPAPPGERWVGYGSTEIDYASGTSLTSGVVVAPFGRPPDGSGGPSRGPVRIQVVVGARGIDATHPIDRPVLCGDVLTAAAIGTGGVCVDSPTAALLATGTTLVTNDLALQPGPLVTTAAGQIALVPFAAEFAGASAPGLTFSLAATTTLAGATPGPTAATLTPLASGTTPLMVAVPVPVGAAPGVYQVTLNASLAGGQTRSGIGTILVQSAAAAVRGGGTAASARPSLSGLTISPRAISRRRGRTPAVISVRLSQAGRLRIVVERRSAGRRANGRCAAPTTKLVRSGARACARYVAVSTLGRTVSAAGVPRVQRIYFAGRVAGRPRTPGVYRVTVTGITAGGLVSTPLRSMLTVTSR